MISYSQFLKSNAKFLRALDFLKLATRDCDSLPELRVRLVVAGLEINIDVVKAMFDIAFDIEDLLLIENMREQDTGRQKTFEPVPVPVSGRARLGALNLLMAVLDDKKYDSLTMSGDFLSFVRQDRKVRVYDFCDGKRCTWKQGIHYVSIMHRTVEDERDIVRKCGIKLPEASVIAAHNAFFRKLGNKVASYAR